MEYVELLNRLTVDCKDDGKQFRKQDRIHEVKALLENSDYELLGEGNLSLLYGKSAGEGNTYRTLVSSHVDCVYKNCFVEDEDELCWKGTFDNSATNAAVIDLMLRGELDESVLVAFTGDEEKDSAGAIEIMQMLGRMECRVGKALVLDVTNEGWEEEAISCLTHSFLNGGRCASNEQAEEGFYVDENGNPCWKPETEKDDITLFLENYQYSTYDIVLNIADLMATSDGIVSPYDRIEDIATRRKLDPTNRGYFLAEFTNTLIDVIEKTGGEVPENMQKHIKATPNVSIDEINEKFKSTSDLFYSHYKESIEKQSDKEVEER